MKTFVKHFSAVILCASALCSISLSAEERLAQDIENNKATNTRFIPVELFTGTQWDGKHELRLDTASTSTKACLDEGKRCTTYTITGPFKTTENKTKIEWAGDEIPYYLRTFSTRKFGKVESHFAINNSKDGLVRIFDKRKTWGSRNYSGVGAKFPLGYWKQGEVRNFPSRRQTSIEIIELDGPNHCLTFRWTVGKAPFRTNSDNNYTFCPGVGLKKIRHNS